MPYIQERRSNGILYLRKVAETEPLAPMFQTGHDDITLEDARRELLRNQNNYDRMRRTPLWSNRQEQYYQTCWQIVADYKRFLQRGLVKSKY